MAFFNELSGILLLATHLLCVNLASTGPLVAAWLGDAERKSPDGDSQRGALAIAYLKKCILAFLLGMVIGGLLIFWSPGPDLWKILQRFPNRTFYFAGLELLFSLGCMIAMNWTLQAKNNARWPSWLLATFTATNLLYHFPPFMTILGKLANDPTWTKLDVIDHSAQLELIKLPEIMALSLHFVAASVVVAAVFALGCLHNCNAASVEETQAAKLPRILARLALTFTLAQIPLGLWLLTSLPAADTQALMGGSLAGSLNFLLALGFTLMLLQRLVAIGWGIAEKEDTRGVWWLTILIVLLMSASLWLSRV